MDHCVDAGHGIHTSHSHLIDGNTKGTGCSLAVEADTDRSENQWFLASFGENVIIFF